MAFIPARTEQLAQRSGLCEPLNFHLHTCRKHSSQLKHGLQGSQHQGLFFIRFSSGSQLGRALRLTTTRPQFPLKRTLRPSFSSEMPERPGRQEDMRVYLPQNISPPSDALSLATPAGKKVTVEGDTGNHQELGSDHLQHPFYSPEETQYRLYSVRLPPALRTLLSHHQKTQSKLKGRI